MKVTFDPNQYLGGVSERPKVTDSKSVVAQATGSSNLPPSAIFKRVR